MKVLSIVLILIVAVASAQKVSKLEKINNLKELAKRLGGRISNGKIARRGQFPHQVGLHLFDGARNWWCSGSLISKEWVLTAAHCTYKQLSINVYLGSTDRFVGETRLGITRKNIIEHEQYNNIKLLNDIALIKIPPVKLNGTIRAIALPQLPPRYVSYIGQKATASGWALTSDSNAYQPLSLIYASMAVMPHSKCRRIHGRNITSKNICTDAKDGPSTCAADSGGPLVWKKRLIGISSFGKSAACKSPEVFTRITDYLIWIKNKTGISY